MTAAPLDRLTSIKTKLGALVGVSVVVAAGVATLGSGAGVAPWLALPITVCLALAVTQLLAVGMTSPLREMTGAATRMADGDYAVRVRADSADEVGQLARAFNQMAADLGAVDLRRRELVATVSHELRTPLTGLIAVLENLDDGVVTPGGDGLRTALSQAERLSAMVRDLLDLSRLEAGAVTLRHEGVVVRELLDAAVAEARSLPRDVAYDVRVSPADLEVVADPARLHQLVANLLDNASRHSPPGATVAVSASLASPAAAPGAGAWCLEVANAGAPIAPADRERIFARFGSASDPAGGGTGLGLAIARWVTDLHGGSIAAVDPAPGADGARLRAVLPTRPDGTGPAAPSAAAPSPTPTPPAAPGQEDPMTTPSTPSTPVSPPRDAAAPAPSAPVGVPALGPGAPPVFPTTGRFAWSTTAAPGRPWILLASAVVGLLAALLLVDVRPGLGATLVLLAGGGVVYAASAHRRDRFTVACAGLAALLVTVLTLRDALWIGVLCALAATVLVVVGSTRARSMVGVLVAGLLWPLSAIAGVPWLGRTLRQVGGSGRTLSILRTLVLSAVALLVFGLLFSSADAVFAGWLDAAVPDVTLGLGVVRAFVGLAVGGLVLATAYFALHPPQVEPDQAAPRRPSAHRYEWLAPMLVVDGVFALFLVSQAAAVFGGHDYVEQTTGLTYADYVHQGFGQLTVATALTVLVVSIAARKAALASATDRAWLRGAAGALCVLTLLVVGSALHRLAVYVEAYGLTRLRLVAGTFELWLGVVVLCLLVAGVGLRGTWLVRAGLLSGALSLLLLAAADPDHLIASTNVETYAETGLIDLGYLDGLSADAASVLATLPAPERACALLSQSRGDSADDSSWAGWTLGRWRAGPDLAAARAEARSRPGTDCSSYAVGPAVR